MCKNTIETLQEAAGQEVWIKKFEDSEETECGFWSKYPELVIFKKDVPRFYHVVFVLKPSEDSCIHAELCIPVEKWNRRFLGTGNGGPGCIMNGQPIVNGLRGGFAVVQYDLGTAPEFEEGITDIRKWNPDAAVGKP